MSLHPLIELASERQVRLAKGFGAAAAELKGDGLEARYREEADGAPNRGAEGKKYLDVKTGRVPAERQAGKDNRHLAMAIGAWARTGGEGLELPEGEKLEIVDSLVPLRTAAPDKARGTADPNRGVEDIPVLGMLSDDRLAVVVLRYLAPDATRSGDGDTPLRVLLEGLAQAAMLSGNREGIAGEIQAAKGRSLSDQEPALIIAGSPRYWEICRKREAQKGAAWIRELERLSREIANSIGVEVVFASIRLGGDETWEYTEEGPLLGAAPDLSPAWELGAGKLKPKPRPKERRGDPVATIVEADFSREPRAYGIRESYAAGDRIAHPKLGEGVVQGSAGRGKISVLFGEDMKLLVHERGA